MSGVDTPDIVCFSVLWVIGWLGFAYNLQGKGA